MHTINLKLIRILYSNRSHYENRIGKIETFLAKNPHNMEVIHPKIRNVLAVILTLRVLDGPAWAESVKN